MSRSQDADHYFQTTQSLSESVRKAAKSKNELGAPIRLKSKILAVIADRTRDDTVYLAESAGQVRKLVLNTGESTQIYRGASAPFTSLALSPDNTTLFAGCWDRTIWSWPIQSPTTTGRRFKGHTDFVKAVLCTRLPSTNSTSQPFDILVSGSADATIIIWNVLNGVKLQTLVGHNRGILCLAIDLLSESEAERNQAYQGNGITLFSGSSDREIRRWVLSSNMNAPSDGARSTLSPEEPAIVAHETGVYALNFDADGDLWTASADGTAKCLSRADRWQADTVIQHEDYVRAVALNETNGLVITAGRDEDVKLWDKASGEFVFNYKGHFDEVTSLAVLNGNTIVSVGIDCTVRQWSLKAEDIERAKREREEARGVESGGHSNKITDSLITEDEEKELAELMGSED